MARQDLLNSTFMELADTLVRDFDVIDLLTMLSESCVKILDVSAAGVMLGAADGHLRCVASSSDRMRILEIFEEQFEEGPCPDSYRTAQPVINIDLDQVNGRWPHFAPKALVAGFHSVHALPMKVRGQTIGALNLFRSRHGHMGEADVLVAQALADAATLCVVSQRSAFELHTFSHQLQQVLNSRFVIEQSKGRVAESLNIDISEANLRIRTHARNHNLRISDLACQIEARTTVPADLDPLSTQASLPAAEQDRLAHEVAARGNS